MQRRAAASAKRRPRTRAPPTPALTSAVSSQTQAAVQAELMATHHFSWNSIGTQCKHPMADLMNLFKNKRKIIVCVMRYHIKAIKANTQDLKLHN